MALAILSVGLIVNLIVAGAPASVLLVGALALVCALITFMMIGMRRRPGGGREA